MRQRPRRALGAALAGCLALGAAAAPVPLAEFVGSLVWRDSAHHLGGFSGLELDRDGTTFVALSDRAGLVSGQLIREDGRLTAITNGPPRPLNGRDGAMLRAAVADSEGLAIGEDGQVWVSFEGLTRVWRYDGSAPVQQLERLEAWTRLHGNSGLEALAIDARGRLFAMPEQPDRLGMALAIYIHDGSGWSEQDLSAAATPDDFLPVGADIGPDGMFYMLERQFRWIGFQSRIRRFAVVETARGPRLDVDSAETLLTTDLRRHDNLEGLAVWRDTAGDIRFTMVSDNNFRRIQRTEFVEYRLRRSAEIPAALLRHPAAGRKAPQSYGIKSPPPCKNG